MELIEELTRHLGISEQQAKGGAGLLFRLAREKLGAWPFSEIAKHVPDMEDLLLAAPESGGAARFLRKAARVMSGRRASGLRDLADLAGGFSRLGLESGMITRFVPVVLSYFQKTGGDSARSQLENAFR